jgi:hypothetical protein
MKYITIEIFVTLSLLLITFSLKAQFAGPVGTAGTSAVYKDSSAFINWASTCVVTRGYQDIANTGGGYASVGADTNGTKKAGLNSVVSLGDGGAAILTFPQPIINGTGFDFAVFENAFDNLFLELAFVEVSSDGINYVRFPATSNTPTLAQIGPFDYVGDATKLNNLAGKYRANYGTPFDLQELQGQPGLNVNNITHVKIIDVVGCINLPYATYDKNSNAVNDPYPTAFGSGGFDLDAIGVIHQAPVSVSEHQRLEASVYIYPNPSTDMVCVYSPIIEIKEMLLNDVNGKTIKQTFQNMFDVSNVDKGIYFIKITQPNGIFITKKLVKN